MSYSSRLPGVGDVAREGAWGKEDDVDADVFAVLGIAVRDAFDPRKVAP